MLGEREGHALELGDRLPERLTLAHPFDGHVHGASSGADAHQSEQGTAELEFAHDLAKPSPIPPICLERGT